MACAAKFEELGGFGGFGDGAGFSSGFVLSSYFTKSDYTKDTYGNKTDGKPQSTSWSDSIGDSIISENVEKSADGGTVTT